MSLLAYCLYSCASNLSVLACYLYITISMLALCKYQHIQCVSIFCMYQYEAHSCHVSVGTELEQCHKYVLINLCTIGTARYRLLPLIFIATDACSLETLPVELASLQLFTSYFLLKPHLKIFTQV